MVAWAITLESFLLFLPWCLSTLEKYLAVITTSPFDEATLTGLKTVLKSFLSKGQVLEVKIDAPIVSRMIVHIGEKYVCENQDSEAEPWGKFAESVDFLSVKILKLGATIKCFLNRTYCVCSFEIEREPYLCGFLLGSPYFRGWKPLWNLVCVDYSQEFMEICIP